jgi:chromosome partitioning protein
MTIIALAGNKGGSGKTTLAINLAGVLVRRGRVTLLDADPQGSCVHWHTATDGNAPVSVLAAADDVTAAVEASRDDSDYLLIDCPPAVDAPQTLAALALADKVLIPVLPSPLDIWAGLQVGPVLQQVQQGNPLLQALMVINQLEPRTKLSQLARQALDELGLPTATTALRRRMAYRRAMLEGRSVSDLGVRGAEAVREIEQLTEELVN